MTTASSRATSPSRGSDPATVAALSAAQRVVDGPWALVLGDASLLHLNPDAHGLHRVVHLHATIGSTPGAALLVAPTTLAWAREAAELHGLPGAFWDPTLFDGSVAILDLGPTVLVEPTAEAIIIGLCSALDTSLVLAPCAPQGRPRRSARRHSHPWAATISRTRTPRAAR